MSIIRCFNEYYVGSKDNIPEFDKSIARAKRFKDEEAIVFKKSHGTIYWKVIEITKE